MTPDLPTGLAALRRELHRNAEVGLHLPRTQQVLEQALAPLPIEWHRGRGLSSLTGLLRGASPGPTVLLRADMDALPITEQTGLDFAAPDGAMHACGHDLHMAGLVGAAHLLAQRRAELHGDVLFAFQPGEEGYGGARLMLDEGLLEAAGARPAAAYALHVVADLPNGVVFCRPGTTMAGYAIVEVQVIGRGAHGGRPHEGADPVPVAAEIITALHSYADRRFDPFDPVVVTVGELHAGAAPNVVADQVTMRLGIRTFSEETAGRTRVELPRLIEGIAAAHGVEAQAAHRAVMRPTVNDAGCAAVAAQAATRLFGPERYAELGAPRAGSEDFSEILAELPGAFAYLGAAFADAAGPAGNHSPRAVFDDSILADAARFYAELALHHIHSDQA